MPNLLSGNSGRIVAVETGDTGYMPLGVVVNDFKTQLGAKGLITSVSVNGQSSLQVMHTLRQYVYFYTFGERCGELSINGLSFTRDCTNDIPTGFARLYDWYELNRISHTGVPILVTVTPGVVLSGLLMSMKFQIEDPSISLGQFSLQFVYPPRIRPQGSTYTYPRANLSGGTYNVGIVIPAFNLRVSLVT